jgi:hypothetical protein
MSFPKPAIYAVLAAILAAVSAPGMAAEAQSTVGKSQANLTRTQAQPTETQNAAAAAQTKCVELLKGQPALDNAIAGLNAKAKELEAKARSLPQSASLGAGSDRCNLQQQLVATYRENNARHLRYLDHIALAIKFCPAQMTERLVAAQIALKKSQDVVERVTIAHEGVLSASCR